MAVCNYFREKKQGTALYLSFKGKARKGCLDLSIDMLNMDDGVDKFVEEYYDSYVGCTTTF